MKAKLQLAADRTLLWVAVAIRAIAWLVLFVSSVCSVVGWGLYWVAARIAQGIMRRQGLA